jgi:hypothetical protein
MPKIFIYFNQYFLPKEEYLKLGMIFVLFLILYLLIYNKKNVVFPSPKKRVIKCVLIDV